MKKLLVSISFLFLLFLATGCSEAKRQLGLTRRTPDEFAVMRRAPLEIPPDLNQVSSLPPPQPGAPRPQETAPTTDAQLAVLGAPSMQAGRPGMSQGEADLLARAGAAQTDPNIRGLVDKEATTEANDQRPVVKRILNIGNDQDPGPASVVDAKAEAQRLKENKQKGAPITTGETPSVDE